MDKTHTHTNTQTHRHTHKHTHRHTLAQITAHNANHTTSFTTSNISPLQRAAWRDCSVYHSVTVACTNVQTTAHTRARTTAHATTDTTATPTSHKSISKQQKFYGGDRKMSRTLYSNICCNEYRSIHRRTQHAFRIVSLG